MNMYRWDWILGPVLFFIFLASTPILAADAGTPRSNDPEWLLLSHYRANFFGGYSSLILEPQYFLASDGRTNPAAELKAMKAALESKDFSALCRFPARVHWLLQKQGQAEGDLLSPCREFNDWKKDIDAQGVSLVMPSSSLASSLSIFSHTFLKIRSNKYPADSTLFKTVSFAASFDQPTSFFEFAYRGIFGGYVGRFAAPSYYEEINHYGFEEDREIFEYRLNLTPDETDQLIRHLWEVHTSGIRYYFFSENCSYFILDLIDIARPSAHLAQRFHGLVIPLETLQEVYWKTDLVEGIDFIPSQETRRVRHAEKLSPSERDLKNGILLEKHDFQENWLKQSKDLTPEQQRRLLTALIEAAENSPDEALKRLKFNALQVRAKLGPEKDHEVFEPLHDPPHLAHHSSVVGGGAGVEDGQNDQILRFRLVDHDLLDPAPGYDSTAAVEGLDGQLMWLKGKAQIQRFTILNLLALRPLDEVEHRGSWFASSQFDRRIVGMTTELPWVNSYGYGASYGFDRFLFYLFATGQVATDSSYDKAFQAGVGARGGFKWSLRNRLIAGGEIWWHDQFLGENETVWDSQFALSYAFGKDLEVRLSDQIHGHLRDQSFTMGYFF